jgi:hypothetical protein
MLVKICNINTKENYGSHADSCEVTRCLASETSTISAADFFLAEYKLEGKYRLRKNFLA